jgi:diguanylate cyclase (GGDEF)-like protein/PAS domain S-box-containing protein
MVKANAPDTGRWPRFEGTGPDVVSPPARRGGTGDDSEPGPGTDAASPVERDPDPVHETALRALNWVVALACLVVASPLMLAIAVAIKLDSGGPVLYRQLRVGRDRRRREGPETAAGDAPSRRTDDPGGRPFCLYKFRTMHPDAAAATGPTRNAPGVDRTTRVGRFLRRHRLDELPRLWSVLKGDMALVGPRPERPLVFERLREQIGRYSKRPTGRPGLAGWFESSLDLPPLLERDPPTGLFRPLDVLNPVLEDRAGMLRQDLSSSEWTTAECRRPVSVEHRSNGDGSEGPLGREAARAFEATLRGGITDADGTLAELLGYSSRQELVGGSLSELFADPAALDRVLGHARAGRELAGEGMTLRTKRGDEVIVLLATKLVVRGGEDDRRRVVGTLIDVTERDPRESDLERLVFQDPLTGVSNRRALDEHAGTFRVLAERRGAAVGFLYVDLARFGAINDRYGHAAGDAVLVEVARRLEAGVRASDVVSRVGGDEFVVLLSDVAGRDAVVTAGRRVKRTLEEAPVELPHGETAIRAEAGIAICPEHGSSLEELIRAADQATCRTKETNREVEPRGEAKGLARRSGAAAGDRPSSNRAQH